MKLTGNFSFVICVSSAILLTGCQSGFIKKPDFGRLAFWKNENLRLAARKDDIPPPSAHFSPDTGEGGEMSDELKSNIDQIIADARMSKTKAMASNEQPIRKPYSLDSIDPKVNEQEARSNDFVSEKLNKIQSAASQALNATENVIKDTGEVVENTANSFVGIKDSFKMASQAKLQQVSDGIKNQANTAVAKTGESINQFARNSEAAVNQTVANVKNSLDNSFQAAKNVITNPYAATTDQQSSSLTTVGPEATTKDFVSRYKQAAEQFGKQTAAASNSKTAVQQSSFDAELKTKTNEMAPPESQPKATQYPSTSFGKFQPLKPADEKTDVDSLKIPPQLLRGTGTFSPGSTKPLRPAPVDK